MCAHMHDEMLWAELSRILELGFTARKILIVYAIVPPCENMQL